MVAVFPTDQWYAGVGENTLADVILGWLMRSSYDIKLQGELLREVLDQLTKVKHLE